MTPLFSRLRLAAGAFVAGFALLGASAPAGSLFYIRVPDVRQTVPVMRLSYDAVATVPQRPHTPRALLPVDEVEGTLMLAGSGDARAAAATTLARAASFIVVEVDGHGVVRRRTAFQGTRVLRVDTVPDGEGNLTKRVRFHARSVTVSDGS